MKSKNFKENSGKGSLLWLLQRISAVFIFVLIMIHFVTYHFISHGKITYSQIFDKMTSPWFNLTQFLFLIAALYHGLNGIWMVSEDYIHHRAARITVLTLILIAGLTLLFIGTATILKVG